MSLKLYPTLYQYGLLYASNRLTLGGAGGGIGVVMRFNQIIDLQPQLHILWGNGNAVATMISAGYHKKGIWQPGIAAEFGLLWGQKIRIVADDGSLPANPTWIIGLRAAPLTFSYSSGVVSALEFGGGIGPDRGWYFELCVLSIGFHR